MYDWHYSDSLSTHTLPASSPEFEVSDDSNASVMINNISQEQFSQKLPEQRPSSH